MPPLRKPGRRARAGRPAGLALPAAMLVLALGGCGEGGRSDHSEAGDPSAGAMVIARQACGSCHIIPGIPDASGMVGPPLAGFRSRQMIAGVVPNTPQALDDYLRDPKALVPANVMPAEGLTEREIEDITAYLETRT